MSHKINLKPVLCGVNNDVPEIDNTNWISKEPKENFKKENRYLAEKLIKL